ncbi:hypothetical protein HOC35_00640 [Candidatus Woesearchaeota archaeon]|jgi:hypothetical protein|nr:hypothetical protein [Candidatus Woesearchaeota archaeon]
MVEQVFQETMIQVVSYAQVMLFVAIFWQVYQIIQIMRGDPTPILKATERQARRKEKQQRRKLLWMKRAEKTEVQEDELEIKDEKALIGLLEQALGDLKQQHGTTEINHLLTHFAKIRSRLGHLEKLEREEIKNYKNFLQDGPDHKRLWLEIQKEGKLTILIEQLLMRAEQNLTANPNLAEKDIVTMINILKSLIVEEKKQEKIIS